MANTVTLPLDTISTANSIPDLVTRVAQIVEILNSQQVANAVFAATANNALYLDGKREENLNANSALYANTAGTANNSTYAYGKTEGALNVNSAATANNTLFAYGKPEYQLNVNNAITANTAVAAETANNSTYAYGKTEGALNVNSAATALTANNSTYAFGKSESALNVNSALTANNSTYAFGKTEGALNVNSALTANDSTYFAGAGSSFYRNADNINAGTLAGARMFVANTTVNGAISTVAQSIAGDKTFTNNVAVSGVISGNGALLTSITADTLNGKGESGLNVNSAVTALTANNADYLDGQHGSFYQDASNINAGTLAGARMFVANTTVNGAISTTTQSLAGDKTFTNNVAVSGVISGNGVNITSVDAALLNGQAGSYYRNADNINAGTLAGARMFVANTTVNGAISTAAQSIAGVKTFVDPPVANGVNITSVNAIALNGKTEGDLNANSALTANNADYLDGQHGSFYQNADNINAGTLAGARMFVANTTVNGAISTAAQSFAGVKTFTANTIVGANTLFVETVLKRVGVNTAPGAYALDVSGDINYSGTLLINGVPATFGSTNAAASFLKLDDIGSQFNGAQTVFTVAVGGTAKYPYTPQNLFLSLNGVWQEPNTAFTLSGTTITFATAPTTGTDFFGVMIGQPVDVGNITPGVDIEPRNVTASGNVTVSGIISGNGVNITSLNASALATGTVPLARLSGITDAEIAAGAAIAWTKISKSGSSLADLATRSASDIDSGTLAGARMFVANTTVNGAISTTTQSIAGDKTFTNNVAVSGVISGNGVNITSVDASLLNGQAGSYYRNADNINAGTLAGARMFVANTTVNGAISTVAQSIAGVKTFVDPPVANGVNITSVNAIALDGQASSYYRNADNINAGTLAGARMFVANTTVNGAISTTAQSIAGDKTFTGAIIGANGSFTGLTANSIVLTPLGSAPVSTEGRIYYDNTGKVLKYHNGTDFTTVGTGSGGSAGVYTHTESVANTTWTVNHNLGTKGAAVMVTDNSDVVLIPNSITYTNANTITLGFSTAQAGKAYVSAGGGIVGAGVYQHTQASNASSWTVTHNLNTETLAVMVVDSANSVIQPSTITLNTRSQLTITFGTAISGRAFVVSGGANPADVAYVAANNTFSATNLFTGPFTANVALNTLSFGGGNATNRFFPQFVSHRSISGMTELGGLTFHQGSSSALAAVYWFADATSSANSKLAFAVRSAGTEKAVTIDGANGGEVTLPGRLAFDSAVNGYLNTQGSMFFNIDSDGGNSGNEKFMFGEGRSTGTGTGNNYVEIMKSGIHLLSGGIEFPAAALTTSGNVLGDFEEGTWTPTFPTTISSPGGTYTKFGNHVVCHFAFSVSATADSAGAYIGGLPFTVGSTANKRGSGAFGHNDSNQNLLLFPDTSATTCQILLTTGSNATRASLSGKTLYGTIIYKV